MDKIKTDTQSLIEKIRKVAFPDLLSEVSIRLAVAKNLFLIGCVLYYGAYLSIVGWLFGEDMQMLVSLGYGVLAFSTFWLLYCLVDYALVIYFEKIRNVRFIAGWIILLAFLAIASIKLGFISPLVS